MPVHSSTLFWPCYDQLPSASTARRLGISAVARGDYKLLRRVFETEIPQRVPPPNKLPAVLALFPGNALPEDIKALIPTFSGRTPASNYMFSVLREDFRELLPSNEEYSAAFDRFEYFVSLTNIDLKDKLKLHVWAPIGKFGVHLGWGSQTDFLGSLDKEAKEAGENWPPLKAGLFGGKQARMEEVTTYYRENILAKLQWF